MKGVREACVIKVPQRPEDSCLSEFITYRVSNRHRNLLNCFGMVKYNGRESLLLEMCELGSLNELHSKYDLKKRFVSIATDLTLAVAHLHNLPTPILHNDIACRNVFIRANWTAVLGDFSLPQIDWNPEYSIGYYAERGRRTGKVGRLPLRQM